MNCLRSTRYRGSSGTNSGKRCRVYFPEWKRKPGTFLTETVNGGCLVNTTNDSTLDSIGKAIEERFLAAVDAVPDERYTELLDLTNLDGEHTRAIAGCSRRTGW